MWIILLLQKWLIFQFGIFLRAHLPVPLFIPVIRRYVIRFSGHTLIVSYTKDLNVAYTRHLLSWLCPDASRVPENRTLKKPNWNFIPGKTRKWLDLKPCFGLALIFTEFWFCHVKICDSFQTFSFKSTWPSILIA